MSYLASNIQFLRKQKKLDALTFKGKAGLTSSLTQIENAQVEPNLDELIRIAELLQVPVDRLLREDLAGVHKKLHSFQLGLLVLDVDGVLTDGGMFYTQGGDEFKKFNAKDGLAIKTLTADGVKVGFLSSGINDRIIQDRAKLLGVQYVYVGTWKKLEILTEWCNELKIHLSNVAYIGDDVNDLAVIKAVGFSACPADAVAKVKQAAHVILEHKGGKGCVREFVERFIREI
jgi:YrbI family 3-deoxy-D-manno-octulosonate 8-phosphate phosphatase